MVSEGSPSPQPPLLIVDAASPFAVFFFCCSGGAADVELVAGPSYSIGLCGLRSLTVAIRGAVDWTADAKWAAASALNCENK